ncbi:MAG: hypothetical protein ACO3JL_17210, partial [Myxococcota bacterium]
NTDQCVETDECVDGDTRIGSTACGASGTYAQTCAQGAWVDTSSCVDTVPTAWSCVGRYGDGICDCGCGAQDYDCAGTADYGECEASGCDERAYPTAENTTLCATPADVCGLPAEGIISFDNIDDVAKHDVSRRVVPGAQSADYALSALSWDQENLYVSFVGRSFEDPYAPLHLYLEVDAVTAASPGSGKSYSALVPKLPFTPTHLVAARRSSLGYNRVYTGTDFDTAGQELATFIATDNHTLSLVVPWSALVTSGCPTTLRLAGHVVKAQVGSEWTETLPPSHTPWEGQGGGFYEIDLLADPAATSWVVRP